MWSGGRGVFLWIVCRVVGMVMRLKIKGDFSLDLCLVLMVVRHCRFFIIIFLPFFGNLEFLELEFYP